MTKPSPFIPLGQPPHPGNGKRAAGGLSGFPAVLPKAAPGLGIPPENRMPESPPTAQPPKPVPPEAPAQTNPPAPQPERAPAKLATPGREMAAYYEAPPPAEPTADLTADQANRLLLLAEQSQGVVERALRNAASPGATGADLAAARAVEACMAALAGAVGPVNRLVDNLRMSVRGRIPTKLTAAQAAALETFATCAIDATEAARAAGRV